MIKLNISNTKVNPKKFGKKLPLYLKKIRNRKQGFCSILEDKEIVTKINSFAKKITGKYESIVILGIGGSALGTICIKQGLTHLFSENLTNKTPSASARRPKLFVIDNIDPILIKELEDVITLQKTLFVVITKSGTTIETMSQYHYFRNKTDKAKLDAKKHFVFITDPSLGDLRKIADEEKIPSFNIPPNVGGRFSVLSAVGLLPAKLMGVDIKKMLEGARKMNKKFLSPDPTKNLPFQLASIQYALEQKGKNIHVLMPYSQKLIKFTDWYSQLLAESIGKKSKKKGKTVHVGITPATALGVTDQHSQIQLYNEGPNDKFIIFMEVKDHGHTMKIPTSFKKNLTFNKLMQAEKEATEESLTKNNRPNMTIEISSVTEETFGELFMLFEGATAFLGEFYNIDAFNQPGVELTKQLTLKKIHGNSKT